MPTGSAGGDLARRLIQRRVELGLTRREVAGRAAMAPGYLRYLEETPAATPGISALIRLAGALRTSLTALTGGDADRPPGLGQATRDPEFVELGTEECWRRLSTHGVGRLAVTTAEGPTVLPVNYSVVDGAIAFRTAPGSTASQVPGTRVAFEVDHIDEAFSQGWSVLLRGPARGVTDPDAVRQLMERAYSTPWAGGRRDMWVCIDPVDITGRMIRERSSLSR
ncbi:pyridoxamine 5'-phosphate oxidase family protein [Streptomyces sp. ME02-8801-2C]|uniref:helix-turn-helix domain-containing protein n=1 Tax=Streptomyces sp. ME02-8801-2C TaxID=3028680 RepID=UPI0029A99C87|nr:pyridoxamine 5'-phosphate oxidase family protein [Streptomyces sp. ME02-8801-2C]MDX3458900.1 pyridoxamine 5'-phosphate oxidase family protein [Streptomyces sp. ME02-8801-2C]